MKAGARLKKPRAPIPGVPTDWKLLDTDPPTLDVTYPLRLVSLSNVSQREHWATKHRRADGQKRQTHLMLTGAETCEWRRWWRKPHAATIDLTRIGPRKLDPGNLEAAFKHVQDAVAEWIGIDDGDERLEWIYAQEQRPAYGVRIRIRGKKEQP